MVERAVNPSFVASTPSSKAVPAFFSSALWGATGIDDGLGYHFELRVGLD